MVWVTLGAAVVVPPYAEALERALQRSSAAIDWCEPNYVYSENIAEFFNTVSRNHDDVIKWKHSDIVSQTYILGNIDISDYIFIYVTYYSGGLWHVQNLFICAKSIKNLEAIW